MLTVTAVMLFSALAATPADASTLDPPKFHPLKLDLGLRALREPSVSDMLFAPAPPPPPEGTDLKLTLSGMAADLLTTSVLAINLHEGSHALAGLASGLKVKEYAPWPAVIEVEERVLRKNPQGGPDVEVVEKRKWFVFGYTRMEGKMSQRQSVFIFMAPQISDLALFTVADLSLTFADVQEPPARLLYFGGMVWTFLDFATALRGFDNPNNDMSYWSRVVLGDNRLLANAFGHVILLFGLYRIVDQGYHLFANHPYVPMEKRTWGIQGGVVPGGFAGQLWIRF